MSSPLRKMRRAVIARHHGARAVRCITALDRLAWLERERRERRELRELEQKLRENRDQERAALDRAAAEPEIA